MQSPKKAQSAEFRGLIDFGVITIRADEFDAALDRFPPRWLIIGDAQYNISEVRSRSGKLIYVATMRAVSQGHDAAHTAAASMIKDLDPTCVVLLGIGGAKPEREFSLGDVIVGTRINDFSITAALSGGRTEIAMGGGPLHPLVQTATVNLPATKKLLGSWNTKRSIGLDLPPVDLSDKNFVGDAAWNKKTRDSLESRFGPAAQKRRPLVTDGALGSGNILVKDPELLKRWLESARDLKAVEMELPGVLAAVRSVKGEKPVLAIRGISDVVGFVRDPAWTHFACEVAASFALAFLSSELLDIETHAKPAETVDDEHHPAAPFNSSAPPPSTAPGWQPTPTWHLREDLARLYIEPQPAAGSLDRFTLAASIALSSIYLKIPETPDSPPLALTIRPTAVDLVPHEQNVQPIPGTVTGRDKKLANVTYRGIWHIKNPKKQNYDSVVGAPLCEMRLLSNGPYAVDLVLRCRDIDLEVEFFNPPADIGQKQFAVLRRVLQRLDCETPEAEYVDLARGGLHREVPS